MKKVWEKPQVQELLIKNTEYGTQITTKVDATFQQGPFTFYSFS